MADGSIRIETKLDNSALKQQIKELERDLKGIQKEKDKTDGQVEQARAKYKEERDFDSQFPEEFSHRKEIDEKAAKELDPLIAKQDALNQKEQQYLAMLDAANAKLAEQSAVMDAGKQVDAAMKADNSLGKIRNQAEYNSLLEKTISDLARCEAHAARISAETGKPVADILRTSAEYQKLSDKLGLLKAKASDFGNEAERAGKKASTGLKRAKKEAGGFGSAISAGIKKIGKMALAVVGIRSAYNAVRMAAREYLATNEQLSGQLETLKIGFGQVLGPAIEWIINLLMQAVGAVNAFVYALSGINFIARANEAALNKQAKAAGGAAKAQNQLAGFDEQTKLTESGGGGGGGGVSLLDATIDTMPAFMQKLVDKIKDGDWYGAGKTVAEALMEGIEDVDWYNVGSTIGEILAGAAAFVVGLLLNIDPETVLAAALELAAGVLDAISAVIQGMDWFDVGKQILDLLLFSLIMLNPFSAMIAVMLTPEGTALAKSAAELIGSILGALAKALVGAATRIGEIALELWNTLKNYFDEYVDWEGTPGEIIQGLFNGIVDALKSVGTWIFNNIWVPFRDGFKKAFGIASPSKRMYEFGGYMMDGLRNGIIGALSKVVNACQQIWSAIKNVFSSVGSWFKTTFTNAWTAVKEVFQSGGKIFDGIKEGIADTFKTIVNGLISGINRVIAVPFNSINSVLNRILGISVLGVSPFAGLWHYNPLSIPQIPKLALGGIVNRPGRGIPAIIGEAGAEAVLPLENHTEWMDVLADKISSGNITIPITLDGKRIATYIVDIQKKKAFAMNGA